VVASFYPLQYVTGRILGDRGSVANLTPPGAEPHDLELSPKDVAALSDARLVVYLAGFQPSVDSAVQAEARGAALNVADSARLTLQGRDGRGALGHDPHFWLDPTRLADVADAVAARLVALDPGGAALFTANAAALRTDLAALDAELKAGLASCAIRSLVTSHEAFAYLAERYGLTQVGIAGLSPEAEPDAGTLATVTDFVRANKVTTIYYETLVSPDVARTVARSTGASTAVLDPIEGLGPASAGSDYRGVMRSNLATLRVGQQCR
jgi:zinc transport system substrate-binding protein